MEEGGGRAGEGDVAAAGAAAGADLDDVVGVGDDVEVVFDGDDGGAVVDDAAEQDDEGGDVSR